MNQKPILSLKNIVKDFTGVRALDNASISVYKGQVMGLVGENGAGKSTILKILSGIHKPTRGDYFLEGKRIKVNGILDAQDKGIAIVHQELEMMKHLTVLENLFVGREIRSVFGTYDWKLMRKKASVILTEMNVNFFPDDIVGNLSIGNQQMVEIAKASLTNAKVICLDEPTSSLTNKEIKALFAMVRKLKAKGMAFIYVSHRMKEIHQICDQITIFRDGKFITSGQVKNFTENSIVKNIVGRELNQQFPRIKTKRGREAVSVKNWYSKDVQDVSFRAYNGEILGFFGLMGAGRSELFKSLVGFLPKSSGKLKIFGKTKNYQNTKQAIKDFVFYLSEDRKQEGLVLEFSHTKNISLSYLKEFLVHPNLPVISKKKETENAEKMIKKIGIKVFEPEEYTKNLSGGNQQKVAIAKALTTEPDILIFDEPTRGIDVGAKLEIYKIINSLKSENKCIIVISSDIQEIIGISDRINVMVGGKLVEEFKYPNFNQEQIIQKIVSHSIND